MITGDLKSKVDRLWDAFWSGGISNPLEIIEQITYLLFIRRLDDLHTLQEKKANRLGGAIQSPIFPSTAAGEKLRWSRFKNFSPQEMFDIVSTKVFPFMKDLRGGVEHSTYAHHMKDARFTVPTPGLLAKVVDLVDDIPMDDRDTKGDVYEYMLGKIAAAGQNGQFRTPRHIIQLMVSLVQPGPKDTICDPACGTAGFLVAASEYIQQNHPEIRTDKKLLTRFNEMMFNGFDFDNTMLRIASMNMLLHGVENPLITYKDSLSEDHSGEEGRYTLILANPPFAGSLDYEACASDLLQIVKTKKTELLFIALFLRLLKPGGRAAIIVPDGVLFGPSKAHADLRKSLIEDHKVEGIISMPAGVFRPYSGVSTAILLFTKTDAGGTDNVWFYDMKSDGWSLDDKRQPQLSENKMGVTPKHPLVDDEHDKNNLPDVLSRWKRRNLPEEGGSRTAQSFSVPKSEIVEQDYNLSINRYKEVVHDTIEHLLPEDILANLDKIESDIQAGMKELREMLQ